MYLEGKKQCSYDCFTGFSLLIFNLFYAILNIPKCPNSCITSWMWYYKKQENKYQVESILTWVINRSPNYLGVPAITFKCTATILVCKSFI